MMTYDQARSLEVGDELVHDSGIKRKVVKYNTGKRHIWLKPRLVGKGKASSMSQTQLIQHHSLPGTVLVPEKKPSKDDIEVKSDAVYDELFFVIRAIDRCHQKGMIPHCEPRIEAYFQLLETWLEDNDHASRD